MSHVAIARAAMEAGFPWVLVLEDDCVPSADFTARWPAIRKALWAERDSWDIFLGGATLIEGPIEERKSGFIEIEQGFALHFYVLNASAYTQALAWQPDRHGQIDVYYSNIYRIVTTRPAIAYQRPGKSDIQEKDVDYGYIFKEADDALEVLLFQRRTRWGTLGLLAVSVGALWWLSRRR